MPSTKKRINLTVPDVLYERLQEYKAEMGISNDASACLQLVTQQLNAHEQGRLLTRLMREIPSEQILDITAEGLAEWKKQAVEKSTKD